MQRLHSLKSFSLNLALANLFANILYLPALYFIVYPRVLATYTKARMQHLVSIYAWDYVVIALGVVLFSGLLTGIIYYLHHHKTKAWWNPVAQLLLLLIIGGLLIRAAQLFAVAIPAAVFDTPLF